MELCPSTNHHTKQNARVLHEASDELTPQPIAGSPSKKADADAVSKLAERGGYFEVCASSLALSYFGAA